MDVDSNALVIRFKCFGDLIQMQDVVLLPGGGENWVWLFFMLHFMEY